MAITAIVRFALGEDRTREAARAAFEASAPLYRDVQGLIRKYYLLSGDGRTGGGVYLFNQTIADAFPTEQGSFSIERDVFPNVRNLYTLQTDADWIDIGVPERLAYAREHFQNGEFQ